MSPDISSRLFVALALRIYVFLLIQIAVNDLALGQVVANSHRDASFVGVTQNAGKAICSTGGPIALHA